MNTTILVLAGLTSYILAFFLLKRLPISISALRMPCARRHPTVCCTGVRAKATESPCRDSVVEDRPMTRAQAEEILDWLEANGYPSTELTETAEGLIRKYGTESKPGILRKAEEEGEKKKGDLDEEKQSG
jgi:hypothetical protein